MPQSNAKGNSGLKYSRQRRKLEITGDPTEVRKTMRLDFLLHRLPILLLLLLFIILAIVYRNAYAAGLLKLLKPLLSLF